MPSHAPVTARATGRPRNSAHRPERLGKGRQLGENSAEDCRLLPVSDENTVGHRPHPERNPDRCAGLHQPETDDGVLDRVIPAASTRTLQSSVCCFVYWRNRGWLGSSMNGSAI